MWESYDSFIEQLGRGAASAGEMLPKILSDPRGYPREVMLLALTGALLVVLLALLAYLIADAARRVAHRRALGVRARRDLVLRSAVALLAVVGIVALVGAAPMTMEVTRRCTGCHIIEPQVRTWSEGPHSAVTCYGCHSQGGVLGAVGTSLREVGRLVSVSSTESSSAVGASGISGGSCLRCHDDIVDEVLVTTVRMRHKDVIEADFACSRCHPDAGHEGIEIEGLIPTVVMRECLGCHDGDAAPAECDTCHLDRPSDRVRAEGVSRGEMRVTCDGCHSVQTERRCIECHGLELPHPQEFMRVHAQRSAADPALCAKCHITASTSLSCACHEDVNVHGTYDEWYPRHGSVAVANGRGGCNCHEVSFCAKCHEQDPFR